MTENAQKIVETYLRDNPQIATVLEIASRVKLAENFIVPANATGSSEIKPTPSPEYQGSRVTPLATQRAWF